MLRTATCEIDRHEKTYSRSRPASRHLAVARHRNSSIRSRARSRRHRRRPSHRQCLLPSPRRRKVRRGDAEAHQGHRDAMALALAFDLAGQLLLGRMMRPPIRGAIAFFLKKPGGRDKNRIDWTLVLAWTGIAIALCVIAFVLTR